MEEEQFLDDEEVEYIKSLMRDLEAFAEKAMREPIDPKIEPLLQVIFALLAEQIELDKSYEWGEVAPQDDDYLDPTEDIPSVDELKRMLGEE